MGDRLVDGETAHAEAAHGVAPRDFVIFTVVAWRGVGALISDPQPTATVPTNGQALEQCGSFSQGATCLMEFGADIGLKAHLIGLKRGPVDEPFMMSGKKHRPLFPR